MKIEKMYYSIRVDEKAKPKIYRIRQETHYRDIDTGKLLKESKIIKTTESKKEATKIVTQLRAKLIENIKQPEVAKKITLAELVAEYNRNKSKSNNWGRLYIAANKRYGKDFVNFIGKNKFIDEIKLKDLQNFISHEEYGNLNVKILKDNSVNHYIRFLKSLFASAVEWNYINENPCKNLKKRKLKDQQTTRALNPDEVRKLLKYCKNYSESIFNTVYIALFTGMRRKEICNLSYDWIDFDNNAIIIPANQTKAYKQRVIFINDKTKELLLYYKDTPRKKEEHKKFVLLNGNNEPLEPNTLTHTFLKICNHLNFLKGTTFHSLRATFITQAIKSSNDVIAVQTLVGHEDMKTTQRYTLSSENSLRRVIEKLNYNL